MSDILRNDQTLRPPPSPTSFHSGERKRKRKALACFHCRRRKVKCGREIPSCGRCREAGQGESCTYESVNLNIVESGEGGPPEEEATLPATTTFEVVRSVTLASPGPLAPRDSDRKTFRPNPSVASTESAFQARRIAQLESRVASLEARQPGALWQCRGTVAAVPKAIDGEAATKVDSFQTSPRELDTTETILFRGVSFMTQYYGGTNPTSLIAHFPELRTFMREAIMHHTSLPRAQRDLKTLQARWKTEKTNSVRGDGTNLLDLLPGRETADHMSELYFNTFETTYRILHAPTFWREYYGLWREPHAARPAFIATLLLAMATVSCISSKEQPTYIGDSSTSREIAVFWIEACDSWLRHQSQKHTYLAIWQIRCLLFLAKQTNTVKKKKTWTFAGNLMREFMSAGFHRDPKVLGSKVSIFDQEMRRRLWSTIVELDLQASIDRGMTSTSAAMPSDSAPPLNINDEDFDEDSVKLPRQRQLDEYTATSFLHVSRSSLSLRISLNYMVNEIGSHPQYDDIMEFDEKITRKLQDIPIWAGSGKTSPPGPPLSLAQTLLDIQLRQFLILLHEPFARQAQSNPRYTLSKITCFNAASSILDQHLRLIECGNYALHIFRNDVFRSALAICHNIYVSHSIHSKHTQLKNYFAGTTSSKLLGADDSLLHRFDNSFVQYIEKSLEMLSEKITKLGTGYTHYWYISAANGLIHSTTSPEGISDQKQKAIDRVTRQYYKVLASQQDMCVAKEKVLTGHLKMVLSLVQTLFLPTNALKSTRIDVDMSTLDDTVSLSGNPILPASDSQDSNSQFEEYYFGDPSAWTFDNLWSFDQVPLPEY